MNFYNQPNQYSMSFYAQPVVSIPEVTLPRPVMKEEPKKTLERMNNPKPEDRLLIDTKRVEKEEPKDKIEKVIKKKEHHLINSYETLKNKFLNVKNKPLFIKRNKDKIKSLIAEEQKDFIRIAKTYFENV